MWNHATMQIAVRKLSFRFLTVELSSRKFEAGMCFRYDTLFKDPLFFLYTEYIH